MVRVNWGETGSEVATGSFLFCAKRTVVLEEIMNMQHSQLLKKKTVGVENLYGNLVLLIPKPNIL